METFLRKYFFTVNLLCLFASGLLVARAANRLLEPTLFGEGKPAKAKRTPSRLGPSALAASLGGSLSGARKDGRDVLKRNIFCSECPPYDEKAITDTSLNLPSSTSGEPVRSTLRLQLVSTLVADPEEWSFAAIRDLSNQAIGLYRVKSELPAEGAVVERIEAAKVIIKNAGRLEYLDLKEEKAGAGVTAKPAPASPFLRSRGTGIAGVSPEELEKGVRKIGENKYEVDRALINKLLSNTGALASTARIVPSQKDGKPNGFRVYGIRPGSLWSAIGVQNGDTVHAINGLDMTTPDKALEVYTKVKNAAHLNISLSRRGTPINMDYTIR